MKKIAISLLASTLLVAAGCSKNDPQTGTEGFGGVEIRSRVDGGIETRAQISNAPTGDDFALRITGEEFERTWERVGDFNASDTLFERGNYTAQITYGDPNTEGVDKPYFFASKTFEVLARQFTSVSIEAELTNSQLFVRATEAFLRYFHDATFTVTTASGNTFNYAPGSETPGEVVYVKAATRITINGTARRQSQTGESEGLAVKFPEQVLEASTARTRHTFTFDAKDAGSATLTITLGEDYVETREFTVELNDEALPDVE